MTFFLRRDGDGLLGVKERERGSRVGCRERVCVCEEGEAGWKGREGESWKAKR